MIITWNAIFSNQYRKSPLIFYHAAAKWTNPEIPLKSPFPPPPPRHVSVPHIQTCCSIVRPTDDKAEQGWRTANIRLAAHYVTRAPGRRLIGSKEPRQIRQLCERAGRGPFVGLSARWGRRLTSRSVTLNSCRVMISSGRTSQRATYEKQTVNSHVCVHTFVNEEQASAFTSIPITPGYLMCKRYRCSTMPLHAAQKWHLYID